MCCGIGFHSLTLVSREQMDFHQEGELQMVLVVVSFLVHRWFPIPQGMQENWQGDLIVFPFYFIDPTTFLAGALFDLMLLMLTV